MVERVFNEWVEQRDLRAELIAAAVRMLAQPQRVAVPSLRSIARACNVAPSAVYWHFPSETELRSAVLDVQYADLIGAVEHASFGAGDGVDALVLAWQTYAAWGLAHPGAYQLLFESGDQLASSRPDYPAREHNRFVELATAVDPAAPLALARLLWSTVHGLVSLRLHKTDLDWQLSLDEAVARVVTALCLSTPVAAPHRSRRTSTRRPAR
jgi:AcrR family transcriptional regulator